MFWSLILFSQCSNQYSGAPPLRQYTAIVSQYEMDAVEATKVVIDKIKRLEPEHVAKKIIGYIYFQGISNEEMIRLALGPESFIHGLIQNAKTARLLAPSTLIVPATNPTPLPDATCQFAPITPPPSPHPHPLLAPPVFRRVHHPYLDHQPGIDQHPLHGPSLKFLRYCDYMSKQEDTVDGVHSAPSGLQSNFYSPESALHLLWGSRTPPSIMDYPVKTCQYFIKGHCKNGVKCRYLHTESSPPENYSHCNPYGINGEDQAFTPGSLEKLELEIIELLKSRRGNPVSIASLPMMYYEKYGKILQAEGYLTESQRHGKAGYSLTKLLARLRNTIRLIDRPHGQHAVVLAEDAPKYLDVRGARYETGQVVTGSHQIYMTFPADSTFTEEDVSKYFNTFGPVQDVRIPCQQKRMFGFVTFASADTVKLILSKGNPHYVCGARVLVKPYREKLKPIERKYLENIDHPPYYNSPSIDFDPELHARCGPSKLLPNQALEEHDQALELQRMRLSQLNLARKPVANQPCLGYPMAGDQSNFPSTKGFNYLLDVLASSSASDDNTNRSVNNCVDQESSQGLNLPDSPFASCCG